MNKTLMIAVLVASTLCVRLVAADNLAVVHDGKPVAVQDVGATWEEATDGLAAEGTGRFLYAGKNLGTGDFHIAARLKLERLEGTAASFVMNDSHLGFDGRGKTLFVEGPLFGGKAGLLGPARQVLKPGVAFSFQAVREKGVTRFLIDDHGETWQEMEPLGFPCVMTFSSVIRLPDGTYSGFYHRRSGSSLQVIETRTEDGGVTWPDGRWRLPMSMMYFVRHVKQTDPGPSLPEGWFEPIADKADLPMTSLWPDGPGGNAIKIKIPMFDATDTESLTAAEIHGRRRMTEVMDFHQRVEKKPWRLDHCSPIIGIRERARIMGDYVFTADDLRAGRAFDDGVARGTFYLDGHKPDDDKRTYILPKDELAVPPYQIPLRSLVARDGKNLMMAGRNLSADQLALSSARVSTSAAMGKPPESPQPWRSVETAILAIWNPRKCAGWYASEARNWMFES